MNAVELSRWRNRPERPQFHARGRLARVGLPARLVDAGLVTSLLLRGQVPGGTNAAAQVRYAAIREGDPRVAYHARVDPDRGLGRPPLHVLLRDERLAFVVRRGQRPRGRPRAVLRRPRGVARRRHAAGVVLRRGPRREGRRPPPALGRPAPRDGGRPPDRLPGRGLARDLPRARRVHHAAAVPGRAQPARAAGPAPPGLARHARPARSGRPGREGRAGAQRPVRGLRPRRRPDRGSGVRPRVDADPRLGRRHVARRLPRAVGPRHRRPVRRRARAGRPEVHAHRRGPPVVGRPAGLRGPRQGPAAVPGAGGARAADRGDRGRAGRRQERGRGDRRRACRVSARRSPGCAARWGSTSTPRCTWPSCGSRRRSSPRSGHGTSS